MMQLQIPNICVRKRRSLSTSSFALASINHGARQTQHYVERTIGCVNYVRPSSVAWLSLRSNVEWSPLSICTRFVPRKTSKADPCTWTLGRKRPNSHGTLRIARQTTTASVGLVKLPEAGSLVRVNFDLQILILKPSSTNSTSRTTAIWGKDFLCDEKYRPSKGN